MATGDTTTTDVTRRRLLAGAAAAGAAVAVPGEALGATRKAPKVKKARTKSADVIVVGAGLSGLVAARDVLAGGKSVIVLEARNRVGGRIWAYDLGGGDIAERGATFIGPTMEHLSDVAKSLGIGTFPVYDDGQNVYVADGQRSLFSDTGPTGSAPLDPEILADLALVVGDLDSKAASLDPANPWDHPQAKAWDGMTLETYIAAQSTSQRFRDLATVACRPIFGAEARDISLLFTVFYIASSGNETTKGTFERNFDTRNGAQQERFVGGSQLIPQGLAKALGKRVIQSQPVRHIKQSGGRVRVTTDGLSVRGRRVIVACSPALAGRISYAPAMPFARDQLMQRVPQGNLVKVTAVYDKPFWRSAGLTGQALSLDGLANSVFDDSPENGNRGVLLSFVAGDSARAYIAMSPDARKQAILADLTKYFGAEAQKPTDYVESLWPLEEFTRGCPVGLGSPGTLSEYGKALRDPVGLIHWAGTETSVYWNGYMDGAVRAGQRAAAEVLTSL